MINLNQTKLLKMAL